MIRRIGVITLIVLASVWSATASATADGEATAESIVAVPTVGPLFADGIDAVHGCTASVVGSPRGDVILTAAHCITGTAAGMVFAPGYQDGRTPYGTWTVTSAYVDPAWLTSQDPDDDFAFLTVADHQQRGVPTALQQVTGANVLGFAPPDGQQITDIAYNAGIDDAPIGCTVPATWTDSFPTFVCHGYVGGSSGSPWLVSVPGTAAMLVEGVIGGLHQGGCAEDTSYAPPFGLVVFLVWLRAALGLAPDTVPAPGGDGC